MLRIRLVVAKGLVGSAQSALGVGVALIRQNLALGICPRVDAQNLCLEVGLHRERFRLGSLPTTRPFWQNIPSSRRQPEVAHPHAEAQVHTKADAVNQILTKLSLSAWLYAECEAAGIRPRFCLQLVEPQVGNGEDGSGAAGRRFPVHAQACHAALARLALPSRMALTLRQLEVAQCLAESGHRATASPQPEAWPHPPGGAASSPQPEAWPHP